MFIIGVTGGIGCGKSTVARIAAEQGMTVLDADEISREVTAPGGAAIPEIEEAFGSRVLGEDGGMDRTLVASMAFRDKSALDRLSAIIHRHVLDLMADRIQKHEESGLKTLMLDVPIPVRSGFLDVCDQVWVVWAKDDIRIARLVARGMRPEDIQRRIAMQMTREEYFDLADHVIWNNDTMDVLRETVRTLLDRELRMRGIRLKREESTD